MPSSPLESVNLVSQGKEKKLSVLETRLPKGEQDQNQVDHHFWGYFSERAFGFRLRNLCVCLCLFRWIPPGDQSIHCHQMVVIQNDTTEFESTPMIPGSITKMNGEVPTRLGEMNDTRWHDPHQMTFTKPIPGIWTWARQLVQSVLKRRRLMATYSGKLRNVGWPLM